MTTLYIAQNDETGDFYLTDDSDLNSHGPIELTDDEHRSYMAAARDYEGWQMFIAGTIRKGNR